MILILLQVYLLAILLAVDGKVTKKSYSTQKSFRDDRGIEYDHDSTIENLLAETPTMVPTRAPTAAPFPDTPPTNNFPPPPNCINNEEEIAYINGQISTTQTFFNCLMNVADPWNIPTFYNGSFNGWMWVNTSIQMNNLHEIDAVGGTATLDFYLRLYWVDKRLNMPLLWSKLAPGVRRAGFEITTILTNDSVGFWLPDIRFHDAASVDYVAQTIRISASNQVFWSRHTVITLMQPRFNFDAYPSDQQTINIRYGSYAFNNLTFRMNFTFPPLSFSTNYDGQETYTENPSWTYDNSSTSYSVYTSGSGFSNPIYHIVMERKGAGIVVRLILPITMLVILAGLTFWADHENRVDSTTTLLLAISALYIVILANIPLLGYLTAIDRYVFAMFLLLVISVILHQSYATINNKIEQWPLRILYMRLLETLGRVGVFPIAIVCFLVGIDGLNKETVLTMLVMVITFTSVIFARELFGISKAWSLAWPALLAKVNNPELRVQELSKMEVLVLNAVLFSTLTFKLHLISDALLKGPVEGKEKSGVSVKHVSTLNKLLYGDKRESEVDEAGRGQLGISMVVFPHRETGDVSLAKNPMRKTVTDLHDSDDER